MQQISVLFVIQISHFVLTNNECCDSSSLMNTFGNFLSGSSEIGDILIAKILRNSGKVELQTYIQGETALESYGTYLILTHHWPSIINLYYWVGMLTSLHDRKKVAKCAVQLSTSLEVNLKRSEFSISIAREKENIESISFRLLLNYKYTITDVHTVKQSLYRYHVNSEFPSIPPNLYVICGGITTRMKMVPLAPKWLKNDRCLILEYGYSEEQLPLSVYCGTETSMKAQNRARIIITTFEKFYKHVQGEVVHQNLNRDDTLFKIFLEVLENSSFSNPYDVDNSNDHHKDTDVFVEDRDQNVKFFEVSCKRSRKNTHIRAIEERPMLSSYFSHRKIYIVDTESIAGIFVLLGCYNKVAKMAEQLKAIEFAEEYLDSKELTTSIPQRMRISTLISVNTVIFSNFDFKINIADFPYEWNMVNQRGHW